MGTWSLRTGSQDVVGSQSGRLGCGIKGFGFGWWDVEPSNSMVMATLLLMYQTILARSFGITMCQDPEVSSMSTAGISTIEGYIRYQASIK